MAAVTGGEDAVEKINSAFDGFEEVGGGSDSHEVAGFGGGDEGGDGFEHVIHFGVWFTNGESADGVSGEVEGEELVGGHFTEAFVGGALDDAEEPLVGVLVSLLGAFGPAGDAFYI